MSFVMLAKDYEQFEKGWDITVKYDGTRCIWDGGLTRDCALSSVPWFNSNRWKGPSYGTGLWSRYGKPIYAPDEWLDRMPEYICLDGELWAGRGEFQWSRGVVSKNVPDRYEWGTIKFLAFDSPLLTMVTSPRECNDIPV